VALRGGRQEEAELHLRRALALLADLEQRDDTLAWALELLGAALGDRSRNARRSCCAKRRSSGNSSG